MAETPTDLAGILRVEREIWGADEQMELAQMLARAMKVLGDLAGIERAFDEAKDVDPEDLHREIGNMITMFVRFAFLLGLDPAKYLPAAFEAQREYRRTHG